MGQGNAGTGVGKENRPVSSRTGGAVRIAAAVLGPERGQEGVAEVVLNYVPCPSFHRPTPSGHRCDGLWENTSDVRPGSGAKELSGRRAVVRGTLVVRLPRMVRV